MPANQTTMNDQQNQSFGKVIWQARRKKRLNQRELASRIGVDYTYLSKLENDHVEPSEKMIRSLAEHLELNAEELMYLAGKMTRRDEEALEELVKANYKEAPALFRRVRENPSLDSLTKARDEQVAKLQNENAELKVKISELEQQIRVYRFYSKEEIERQVNELLRNMETQGYSPKWPCIAEQVAEFLKIKIIMTEMQPDEEGLIVAKIEPLERKIILNQDLKELGGGFAQSTIAHEIGHWILHVNRDEVSNLNEQLQNNISFFFLDPFCFCCRGADQALDKYRVNSQIDRIEWQAQYFASCLLMPRHKLEEVRKGRDLTKWHHLYAMKDEFGVTISNLVHRLQDLGWIYIPRGSKQIYLGNNSSELF